MAALEDALGGLLAPGESVVRGFVLFGFARNGQFPGSFLVADAAGARVLAENTQVVGRVGGVGAGNVSFFRARGEGFRAAGADV